MSAQLRVNIVRPKRTRVEVVADLIAQVLHLATSALAVMWLAPVAVSVGTAHGVWVWHPSYGQSFALVVIVRAFRVGGEYRFWTKGADQ